MNNRNTQLNSGTTQPFFLFCTYTWLKNDFAGIFTSMSVFFPLGVKDTLENFIRQKQNREGTVLALAKYNFYHLFSHHIAWILSFKNPLNTVLQSEVLVFWMLTDTRAKHRRGHEHQHGKGRQAWAPPLALLTLDSTLIQERILPAFSAPISMKEDYFSWFCLPTSIQIQVEKNLAKQF